ncbi:MAG: radical SAM protein [Chloroflexi bacterium]|nr:radical SAM protein [Chloroflexota bacterium]
MNTLIKLQDIANHMDLELGEEVRPQPTTPQTAPCGVPFSKPDQLSKKESLSIYEAVRPDGKPMRLFKTLLTSACERNCYYCPFRTGRNYRRQTLKPEEMAQTFSDLHRAGVVDGLFLSSGIIKGGVSTQDRLLDTADILRHKHHFSGYLHLKIMPGAEKEQVRQAMQLANRLSVNLEAPNDQRLLELAPKKMFVDELLTPLRWVNEIRQNESSRLGWHGRWPSTTTQFVVGGTDESDLELLTTTEFLHKHLQLCRVYFSPFKPVKDTPLENRAAASPLRQHRLYQTAFLFRDYGFDLEELAFDKHGNLPLEMDPKLAWAWQNLQENPVELNQADKEDLLRVPGIGPQSAYNIVAARRQSNLRELQDLQQIGVTIKRMKPFVLLDGKRPSYQLPLF